jgi:chromosome segregation and condensation protein ScpB
MKPLRPLTKHQLGRIDDLLESGQHDLVAKVERLLQNYKGHGYDIEQAKKEYHQYLQRKHIK